MPNLPKQNKKRWSVYIPYNNSRFYVKCTLRYILSLHRFEQSKRGLEITLFDRNILSSKVSFLTCFDQHVVLPVIEHVGSSPVLYNRARLRVLYTHAAHNKVGSWKILNKNNCKKWPNNCLFLNKSGFDGTKIFSNCKISF